MKAITIIRPDDWHLHIRDGSMLKTVLPATAEVFGRAIIMPNLRPPIVTTEQARHYQAEILAALPNKSSFKPLMTLYLTDATSPNDVAIGKESGLISAVKLYPANATTNSEHGVSDLKRVTT
ncbi:MAG: dihydroorotase, partial [Alphaproteobacteria bacterium]|nr:dihydroorotase [Alphaproteobacteria bacterium]